MLQIQAAAVRQYPFLKNISEAMVRAIETEDIPLQT
jgi:hypothetical protein